MSTVMNNVSVAFPFPGLRPFQEGEEHLFFGRECQTDTMIDKLAKTRFLAVIGSSGSGKSSLVNCGLCLGLHSGLMPQAGTAWRIASCRPGKNPIRSLAQALAEDGVLFSDFPTAGMTLADMIETNLRMSKLGIVDVLEQSRQADTTNLLIVIDQFEELFRFATSNVLADGKVQSVSQDARAFIRLLLTAVEQQRHPIYVVLTMRSEFLGDCTQFEGLTEAINEGQYLVPRMTREQRKLAIAGPIGVAGASIDNVLLTRLVNDLGDNPDQLSILQHALSRIWAHWRKQQDADAPLGLENYRAVGSMENALDNHAEKAFRELVSPRQQRVAEKLFKALTDKTTHTAGIRRPTALSTLCELTDCEEKELITVIDAFRKPSRSFLMPRIDEPLSSDSIIDISHESLMRMWRRLIQWSDDEADSARMYLRLASTAALHAENKAGLWRDPDLQLALDWRHHNEPNAAWASHIAPGFDQAMQFLDNSRALADEEKEAKLKVVQQERELTHSRELAAETEQRMLAERDAAKRQKRFLASIIVGLVGVMSFGWAFYTETQEVAEINQTLKDKDSEVTSTRQKLNAIEKEVAETNKTLEEKTELLTNTQKKVEGLTKGVAYISEHLNKIDPTPASDNPTLQEQNSEAVTGQ